MRILRALLEAISFEARENSGRLRSRAVGMVNLNDELLLNVCYSGLTLKHISHQYSAPGVKVQEKLTRHLYKEGRSRDGTEDNRWRAKYLALQAEISRSNVKSWHPH